MDDDCTELPLVSPPKSSTSKEPSHNDEKNGAGSSHSGCASPDPNCAICLGKLDNKCFTDSCFHQFCFACLLEWSKVKPECPLCKQRFQSIIHNVRSIEDFDQYYVCSTTGTADGLFGIIAAHIGSYEISQPREPFRYRTTVSNYLDYFVRLEEAISHHVIPSLPTSRTTGDWRRRRQHGTSDFRRNIYQQGLWVQRTSDITGRVRECTPEFFNCNPAQVHRLVPWLNRELNVLCSGNYHQVQRVTSRILELITQVPIRSPGFSAAIAPYIGRHTEHFVHEFYSFATSPYDLIGYDRHATYVGRDSIANDINFSPLRNDEDGSDSDVQILGPYTSNSIRAIQLDSDSDECVVVDSVPPRQPSPEVITLESDPDDDVVQVNIHIESDINRPGPSRRPPLKRNWLTVKNVQVPKSNNDNLNVSINIAHGRRSRSSSTDSYSSSSWASTKNNKKPAKKKYKKEQCKKTKIAKSKSKSKKGTKVKQAYSYNKDKQISSSSCVKQSLSSSEDDKSRVKQSLSSSEDDKSQSPVIAPRRRGSTAALKSSDDDDDNDNCALHKVTDSKSSCSMIVPQRGGSAVSFKSSDDDSRGLHILTDESSCSSSDEFKQKPRLRSVVVKSKIKLEHQDDSPDHLIRSREYNKSYKSHKYSCRNSKKVDEEYSDWSWSQPSTSRRRSFSSSSSENLPLCKCKCSKKKLKRERM